ncbi:tripartite motif-containing protein 2-like [Haliotis rufescens]|uniref:tripartite motif-containing protein 2-like n=1 Tax=Haliotis rufescens TaxID=6454 RepID=UPI00201F3CA6|nr:tripartite motif-containing protein 2-like [Haliotis rufescens]
MSDFIAVSAIKNYLTECPICNEQFDEASHLPLRMPCCVQCICHDCLQKIYKETDKTLLCPISRHNHHLPNGVESLPSEPLILKILDDLKIHKGLRLPCTDCPDNNEAVARCDDCCVFMCTECKTSHGRHRLSRHHSTVTFEEMKGRPVQSFRRLHQCSQHQQPQQFYCYTCDKIICVSCTVLDHEKGKGHNVVSVAEAHQDKAQSTDDTLARLEVKTKKLSETETELTKRLQTIMVSTEAAKQDINQTFDNLIDNIQERRAILLSDVEQKSTKSRKLTEEAQESTRTLLTKLKSSTEYTKQMRGKADQIEDLQLMLSSAGSLNTLLEESPKEVAFFRTGVSCVPGNLDHLVTTIKSTGLVRSITFSPSRRPNSLPEIDTYNTITLEPTEVPEVPNVHKRISGHEEQVTCPTLEWDSNTASDEVTISGSVITNTRPDPPQPDTGCRIQSGRHAMASRPLVIRRGQRDMFHVKARYTVKHVKEENKMVFELALTSSPADAPCCQCTGLSVHVVTCTKHKQHLCLRVMYNTKPLTDIPLCKNQIGESHDLHLCFFLDGTKGKINVVDVVAVKRICTVKDAAFDRPLWIMMCADTPSNLDIRGELISGHDMTVSDGLSRLLSSLYQPHT